MTFPAKYFKRSEFSCKCGCGFDTVDAELLKVLVGLRTHYDKPITINSGCRCKAYNNSIGGSEKSQHLIGKAADIVIKGMSPDKVADYLSEVYMSKYGIGRYKTFTHIDVRENKSRWTNP